MKKNKGVLARVLSYSGPYAVFLALSLLLAAGQALLTLYAPILSGRAIDLLIGAGQVDFAAVGAVLLRFVIVIAGAALLSWLMSLCTNVLTVNTVRDIRNDAFRKIASLPLSAIDGQRRGDIMSRVVNDVDLISDGLLHGFSQLFSGIFTIAATVVFMLTLDLTTAIVVIALTPVSLIVATVIARGCSKYFKRQSEIRGSLSALTEELTGSPEVVRLFSYEKEGAQRFRGINARLKEAGFRSQFYSALINPSTRFVNGLVYAAVCISGALRVIGGSLSVGGLSAFLVYANQYTKPFNEISGVVAELQAAIAGARRVFEFIDLTPEAPDPADAAVLESCAGEVRAEGVSFAYDPARPLIRNMNFEAKPGQRVAIVGPTGCGKTTLINLLMRFYETNAGNISVDGRPVRQITRPSLRARYGMVLQDSWLFTGTIRDNLKYGNPDVSDGRMVEAAKSAHIHGFISRLPQGYDTLLDDAGGSLSQGQKQLMCIARVMLTDPDMLILDEATSSIDTRTELRVQQAFERMMQGRTSFIVAHRLSTIVTADLILVMRDGDIIEQGTHESLLAAGGFYKKLYYSQFDSSSKAPFGAARDSL